MKAITTFAVLGLALAGDNQALLNNEEATLLLAGGHSASMAAAEDIDLELIGIKSIGKFFNKNKGTIMAGANIAGKFLKAQDEEAADEELFSAIGNRKMHCKAMTPACMGQEAYDRWVRRNRAVADDLAEDEELLKLRKIENFFNKNQEIILGTAKKILGGDDEFTDEELLDIKKIGEFFNRNAGAILGGAKLTKSGNDELTDEELWSQKGNKYLIQHKGTILGGAKVPRRGDDEFTDEELFNTAINRPIRCMAMTPACMGQEAYDRWVRRNKAVADDLGEDEELLKLKKIGKFFSKNKDTILGGAKMLLGGDDEFTEEELLSGLEELTDEELLSLKKVGKFVNKNKGTILGGAKMFLGGDDEFTDEELLSLKKVGKFVNKNKGTIIGGAKMLLGGDDEFTDEELLRVRIIRNMGAIYGRGDDELTDEELLSLKKVGKFVNKNKGTILGGAKMLLGGDDEFTDEELRGPQRIGPQRIGPQRIGPKRIGSVARAIRNGGKLGRGDDEPTDEELFSTIKNNPIRCRALTPRCMGQEAYDKWVHRNLNKKPKGAEKLPRATDEVTDEDADNDEVVQTAFLAF